MLNIPDSVKALYKQDGVRKNFRAHFPGGELPDITNDNIVQESVKFTESICSQDVFKFGLTEASVIEFETVGVANMYGMMIECSSEIDCSSLSAAEIAEIEAGTWDGTWDGTNKVFAVPYGMFRVESCPRDHQAMTHRRVTAYSIERSEMLESTFIPRLPVEMYCPSILVDINAIHALMYGSGVELLKSGPPDELGGRAFPKHLYDSAGAEYSIGVYQKTPGQDNYFNVDKLERVTGNFAADAYSYSFVKLSLTDEVISRYDASGKAISAIFDSRGLDLTFSPDGRKVYANNESALKDKMPYAFFPAMYYVPSKRDTLYYTEDLPVYVQMENEELYPVLTKKRGNNSAFISNDGQEAFLAYVYDNNGGPFYLWIRKEDSGGTVNYEYIEIQEAIYPSRNQILRELYGLENYGAKIKIDNTSYIGKTKTSPKFNIFSFADSVDMRKLVNAELELSASFGAENRIGKAKQKRLSNNSPIVVPPCDYSQMWFDEYDVEPIGIVRYSYLDEAGEEQVVDYRFGDGASVYDMTDNEVLKMMDGASRETIEALLDNSFVPYLAPINFTPIDLEMKGLPYIEAGDALAVTAQDGTVCNSYALRRVLNGVQVLSDQIDSESGLIIDSEEGST